MSTTLQELLETKRHDYGDSGFEPIWFPDQMFDFQKHLAEWNIRKGRSADFADCGLGKSVIQLTFGENVVRKTNKPVLLIAPLAVSHQMIREADKFGIEAEKSNDGKISGKARVVVTNYERLHHFDRNQFSGVICDESSILKNCDGATRDTVTEFMRKSSYRLLCTATPSPNDLIELGTSSEALGYMGFNDMLTTFFKKDQDRKTHSRKDEFRSGVWRFRGHAEQHFFRWLCSWSRAIRKPSDIGFSDDGFDLPELVMNEILVESSKPLDGMLIALPAVGLREQRGERRNTLEARIQAAADAHNAHDDPSVAWCHLNPEGDGLAKAIKGAVQVSGSDSTEYKEEVLSAFADGKIKKLVTKPTIAGFGLNWQHCAHQTYFPSHSFEQVYQCIRRSWRFGQTRPVRIDMIASEGERGVMENMMRKSENADLLFENLVRHMADALNIDQIDNHKSPITLPSWLAA